jgi:hypothetical protein
MKKKLIILIICLLPIAAGAATAIMSSFNAGEVSPRLYGRTDIRKYYSGCRELENMFVRTLGPVEKRPGTYYIGTAADEARVISFTRSTTTGYVLEFSNGSIRFFKDN